MITRTQVRPYLSPEVWRALYTKCQHHPTTTFAIRDLLRRQLPAFPQTQSRSLLRETVRKHHGLADAASFSMAPTLGLLLSHLPSFLLCRITQDVTQYSPLRFPDSEISSVSDLDNAYTEPDETLTDRIYALKDIVPPRARARIASTSSSIYNLTGNVITYGGKGLWILATSAFLLGIPYALALGQEQEIVEEEKRQGMMTEGASALLQPGEAAGEVKQSL